MISSTTKPKTMKKLLIYFVLSAFCFATPFSSESCNVTVVDVQLKQPKLQADVADLEFHPLSIFSLKY